MKYGVLAFAGLAVSAYGAGSDPFLPYLPKPLVRPLGELHGEVNRLARGDFGLETHEFKASQRPAAPLAVVKPSVAEAGPDQRAVETFGPESAPAAGAVISPKQETTTGFEAFGRK
jgi:hypothetical protein